jgi:hypothetical protein
MTPHETTDAIAHIESHRQAMAKEAGPAAACNEALRKLHELLEREREALQLHGAADGHGGNVATVTAEIDRLKQLVHSAGKGVMPKHGAPQARKHVGPGQPHNAPRNKGRRTMGRTSGR